MNHFAELTVELFKRGDYSVLTKKNGEIFEQQDQAFRYLSDHNTEELLFGGGAGGAKSYTGWMWETLMSLAYDETHYFVAREVLKDIRLYGMQTFSEVVAFLGLEKDVDYKYHVNDSYLEFYNKSKIYFLECKRKPSDVDFHGLGSSLFTSGFIEEAGSVHFDAYDTLCSRVNRWKNDDYNLLGKIFITCNPSHNWLYSGFYKADKEGKLNDNQKYIPALAKDNPFCQRDYIRKLDNLKDPNKRARLYLGKWEYDDDPSSLIESYDAIVDIFTNAGEEGAKYITCDAARFGSDKARILVWDGYAIIDHYSFDISKTTDISGKIKEFQKSYTIGSRRVIIDSDGVGGGVVDELPGSIGFVNNASPIKRKENDNFDNLQSQCGFMLADCINDSKLAFTCDLREIEREEIKEELEQLKRDDVDSDTKKRLLKKKIIKQNIGRSPDWRDALLMRFYFDLIKTKRKGMKLM